MYFYCFFGLITNSIYVNYFLNKNEEEQKEENYPDLYFIYISQAFQTPYGLH